MPDLSVSPTIVAVVGKVLAPVNSEVGISQNDVRTVSWRALPAQPLEGDTDSTDPVGSQASVDAPPPVRPKLRAVPKDYDHVPPVSVVSPGEHGAMRRPSSEWRAPPLEDWALDSSAPPPPGPILVRKFEEQPMPPVAEAVAESEPSASDERSPILWILGTALVMGLCFIPLHAWLSDPAPSAPLEIAQVSATEAVALAPLRGLEAHVDDPKEIAVLPAQVGLNEAEPQGQTQLNPEKKVASTPRKGRSTKKTKTRKKTAQNTRKKSQVRQVAPTVPQTSVKKVDVPSKQPATSTDLLPKKATNEEPLTGDDMARLLRGEEQVAATETTKDDGLSELLVASSVEVTLPLRLNHSAPIPAPGSVRLTLRTLGGKADSVSLIWRVDKGAYQRVQMSKSTGQNYVVSLPLPEGGRLQYYFEGVSESGKTIHLKKEFPYSLMVSPSVTISPRRRSAPPVSF